jgi:nucleoside-diphosphate-sugar epimerase
MNRHRCAVTGASGYLGSRIAAFLEGQGWEISRLGRSSQPAFTLEEGLPEGFFSRHRINALVHCAYDFGPAEWKEIRRVNVEGSVRLLEQAKREGVDAVVFVSTMSAYPGCRSWYGKAKLEIEARARELGAAVVQPGLIYGESPGGMVGKLVQLVRISPVLPLIGSGRQPLYAVHEHDLERLIQRLLLEPSLAGNRPVLAAHPRRWTFRQILAGFGRGIRPRIFLVPVPWRLVWLALRLPELLRLRLPLRSDSVVSLVHQNPSPDFSGHEALTKDFRPLFEGAP